MTVSPYNNKKSTKKEEVAIMFNNIAKQYDFLNHFLSMGIDKIWRRNVLKIIKRESPKSILDVATGTADLAIAASRANPNEVQGVDISAEMLEIGKSKILKKGLNNTINLQLGDCENLPFDNNKFDVVTVSFGVRNFENLEKGLKEMLRVTKDGGRIIILEFSKPERFPIKHLYSFYFKSILPFVGKYFSKDSRAYTYLPESVNVFPYGDSFLKILHKLGYKNLECFPQTFGISTIYTGIK